jgi:hypothetical protein
MGGTCSTCLHSCKPDSKVQSVHGSAGTSLRPILVGLHIHTIAGGGGVRYFYNLKMPPEVCFAT